jgi:hypothetical protein
VQEKKGRKKVLALEHAVAMRSTPGALNASTRRLPTTFAAFCPLFSKEIQK